MSVPCVSCKGTESPWTKYLLRCCSCHHVWHHTCHKPRVPNSEMSQMLIQFERKKRENLKPTMFDWTCGQCRNATKIDVDDDDIQIIEQPATKPTVDRTQNNSGGTKFKKTGPIHVAAKAASKPEIVVLSSDDDDDIVEISNPKPSAFATGATKSKQVAVSNQFPPPKNPYVTPGLSTPLSPPPTASTALPLAKVPDETGTYDDVRVVSSTFKGRPQNLMQPTVKVEPPTADKIPAISRLSMAPSRSVSLSGSLMAGLSNLSVAADTTSTSRKAKFTEPIVNKPPKLIHEWIAAKFEPVVSAPESSRPAITRRRPRKSVSARHIRNNADINLLNFYVDSLTRERKEELRRHT